MDKLYTIQEVADKLSLSDKTLRRWEEAGRFMPSRTLGNQRRYTIEDLQILDAIKHNTITEQKDLLTIEQAGKLCGVSPTTILRWEDSGKIHPFITSGNTYYPRQKLVEKMEELKKLYVEPAPVPEPYTPGVKGAHTPGVLATDPVPVPPGSDLEGSAQPRDISRAEGQTLQDKPGRTDPNGNLRSILTNALITLVLILSYHLIFNQTSVPVSPQTGSVQGASTIATPDPRLDDLITKFQEHVRTQMLKDAKPLITPTIKLDNASLISGSSTLPKNKDQISVTADKIISTTPVTVTFTSDYAPAKKYWVTPTDGSFTLYTDFPVSSDSSFNYSFIGQTSTPSATPISTPSAILR